MHIRIYSISSIILVLLGIWAGYYFFTAWIEGENLSVWVIVPVILLSAAFLFKAHMDHWWLSRHTPELDERIKKWLDKYHAFYKALSAEEKIIFENRLYLYLEGRAFTAVGREEREVPYDIQAAIASQGIQVGFYQEDYLLGDFDRIFVYKHPFPTPLHPYLHTVEVEEEDGVLIFSLDHAIHGITNPTQYFNIVLYAYLQVWKILNRTQWPIPTPEDWEILKANWDWDLTQVKTVTGLQDLNEDVIFALVSLQEKEKFDQYFPQYAHAYDLKN